VRSQRKMQRGGGDRDGGTDRLISGHRPPGIKGVSAAGKKTRRKTTGERGEVVLLGGGGKSKKA